MSETLINNSNNTFKEFGDYKVYLSVDRMAGYVSGTIIHQNDQGIIKLASLFRSIHNTEWEIDFSCLDGRMPEEIQQDPALSQVDAFIQDITVENDFAKVYYYITESDIVAYENGYLNVDKTWLNMGEKNGVKGPALEGIHPAIRKQLYEMLSISRKTTGIFYAFDAKDGFPGIKGSLEFIQFVEKRAPVFIGYQDDKPDAVVYYLSSDGFLKVSETTLPKSYLDEHYATVNQYRKFSAVAKESFSNLRQSLTSVIE